MNISFVSSANFEQKSNRSSPGSEGNKPNGGGKRTELNEEEKSQIQKLKQVDQQVRAHEMAHVAAGGGLIRGGVNYKYENGPDGNQYAIGGEVSIDSSPVPDDPSATITKMQQVQRAALAPSNPSSQDRQVAASASANAANARVELIKKSGDSPKGEFKVKINSSANGYTSKGTHSPSSNPAKTILDVIV
jgi:hypothetical protein